MAILLIEHRVPDFGLWKQVFDSDPVGRQQHGVLRHRVFRQADDPSYVVYCLEFPTRQQAEAFRSHPALREAQRSYQAEAPRARVLEEVESVTY